MTRLLLLDCLALPSLILSQIDVSQVPFLVPPQRVGVIKIGRGAWRIDRIFVQVQGRQFLTEAESDALPLALVKD